MDIDQLPDSGSVDSDDEESNDLDEDGLQTMQRFQDDLFADEGGENPSG
jgi:hypothetical protein